LQFGVERFVGDVTKRFSNTIGVNVYKNADKDDSCLKPARQRSHMGTDHFGPF
jgi:hypothetical protein